MQHPIWPNLSFIRNVFLCAEAAEPCARDRQNNQAESQCFHIPAGSVEDLGGASLVSSVIAGEVDARGKSLTSMSRAPKSHGVIYGKIGVIMRNEYQNSCAISERKGKKGPKGWSGNGRSG